MIRLTFLVSHFLILDPTFKKLPDVFLEMSVGDVAVFGDDVGRLVLEVVLKENSTITWTLNG
jgi:hypothetical protein